MSASASFKLWKITNCFQLIVKQPASFLRNYGKTLSIGFGKKLQAAKMTEYVLILTVINTLLLALVLLKMKAGEDE